MAQVNKNTGELLAGSAPDSGEWETVREEFGESLSFTTPGQTFIGTYESVSVVALADLNNPGEMRDSNAYAMRTPDGKKWTLWGSYNIDAGMSAVPVGSLTRIVFVGKVEVKGKSPISEYRIGYKK